MKTNKPTAPKSTELTDAPEKTVLTDNSNNSMQSNNHTNSTNAVISDNAVNSTTTVNPDNLFGSDKTANEVMAQPKQQRIGKQQRKSDFADFKATYLTPSKLLKRHPVNIEDSVWAKLERIARILGDRDTTVGSYINAILVEHLNLYADDIEIWRKL